MLQGLGLSRFQQQQSNNKPQTRAETFAPGSVAELEEENLSKCPNAMELQSSVTGNLTLACGILRNRMRHWQTGFLKKKQTN